MKVQNMREISSCGTSKLQNPFFYGASFGIGIDLIREINKALRLLPGFTNITVPHILFIHCVFLQCYQEIWVTSRESRCRLKIICIRSVLAHFSWRLLISWVHRVVLLLILLQTPISHSWLVHHLAWDA